MNLNQDQKPLPVRSSENRRAIDRIQQARERFREITGQYPSVIQVGEALFAAAYPNALIPHHGASIEGTLIMPRPDVCGKWGLVVIKPPELRHAKTESAA